MLLNSHPLYLHTFPTRRSSDLAGRDLSNDVRFGDGRAAAQKCELVDGTGRAACMRGVVYALIDNTWDGRYALPFCTDRKSTRLNSSHVEISYAVFCLKKKKELL